MICFDKSISKKIIVKNNILSPKFTLLKKRNLNSKILFKLKKIYKKFVIKPSKSGSSYGVKIIKNKKDLEYFIKNIEIFKKELPLHNEILIE